MNRCERIQEEEHTSCRRRSCVAWALQCCTKRCLFLNPRGRKGLWNVYISLASCSFFKLCFVRAKAVKKWKMKWEIWLKLVIFLYTGPSLYEINYFPVTAILHSPFRYTLILIKMNIFSNAAIFFETKLLPYVIQSSFGIKELSSHLTTGSVIQNSDLESWKIHLTAIDLNGLKTWLFFQNSFSETNYDKKIISTRFLTLKNK